MMRVLTMIVLTVTVVMALYALNKEFALAGGAPEGEGPDAD